MKMDLHWRKRSTPRGSNLVRESEIAMIVKNLPKLKSKTNREGGREEQQSNIAKRKNGRPEGQPVRDPMD
jgi:hypothetical protein